MRKFQLLSRKLSSFQKNYLVVLFVVLPFALSAQSVAGAYSFCFLGAQVGIGIDDVDESECNALPSFNISWNGNPYTINPLWIFGGCAGPITNPGSCSGFTPPETLPATVVILNGPLAGTYNFDAIGALPVELVRFTATVRQSVVLLSWQTASELNNEGFEVQRSADGEEWRAISFTKGMGTTSELQNYHYTDQRPFPGTNYYRLKQMDFDGQYEYSNIVAATTEGLEDKGPRVFPNPTSGVTTVYLDTEQKVSANFVLFDLMGQRIRSYQNNMEAGMSVIPLDLSDLPAGIYLLQVNAGDQKWQQRLMVK